MEADPDDSNLPPGAEHVGQPAEVTGINFVDGQDNNYLTAVCTKVNALGMNLWLSDFPVPGTPDYFWNPRDLPGFWGIQP
eukprot:7731968-Prorocentrum_lima.AAC.1